MARRSWHRRVSRTAGASLCLCLILAPLSTPRAGVYVTETSGIRWNDVGGIRWNDVGGIRWNDVGGIRWNDVGGIRWNDVGGVLFTDASGIRWNDVGGIRWNDVGGLEFDAALSTGRTSLDLELLDLFSTLPDTSSIHVIITYRAYPGAGDLADLNALGIPGGTLFRRLPMVVVNATRDQIRGIAALPAVRSVYADRTLSFFDLESNAAIGVDEVEADPDLLAPGGRPLSGAGVTIAVLDTGVDGTHPDLPAGTKVLENVRLTGAVGTGPGFLHPQPLEGQVNSDLVLGHGTFVASVAAGTGAASSGRYRGVAPGASVLALSAGDVFIVHVLEGFDYILENAGRFGVRVVNCSWGTQGWFDPDDPVNVATRILYDAGITVVFAVGNHGPAPDTLNPYSVAPWVIGVGSADKAGRLSSFSSRGIFEELLYHPVLFAPGDGIVAAKPASLPGVSGVAGVADPSGGVVLPPVDSAYYDVASGTSFAAPHVAGIVALMLERNPLLAPGDIKRILQKTATPHLGRNRSEVGAGRLDAWAAVTAAADPARPFGTHVPGWLDERPYRIVHAPATEGAHRLTAGGRLTLPAVVDGTALAWQATLAWGTLPGFNDLDVLARDGSGKERGRSEAFNGASLFGRAEGLQVLGALPAPMSLEVFFKSGTGIVDQEFHLRQEAATAAITAYTDVEGLAPSDRDLVTRAVTRHVLIGRGTAFDPGAFLTRGELARALALAAGLPQRIPARPSFGDTDPRDPAFPYVETVAGSLARRVLIDPAHSGQFAPGSEIPRLDFAVFVVRAAGLEEAAAARAGESLAVLDEESIPLELRGFAAVALEQGLLETIRQAEDFWFKPQRKVTRLDAARYLPRLLDLR